MPTADLRAISRAGASVAENIGAAVTDISDKVTTLKDGAGDALQQIVQGVGRVVNKALPAAIAASASLQYRGSQGSFISFTDPIQLESRFMQIAGDNSDKIGYPCHAANTLLSNLSGFVLCENAVIEISGSITEEQAIEDFLNAGIFIET